MHTSSLWQRNRTIIGECGVGISSEPLYWVLSALKSSSSGYNSLEVTKFSDLLSGWFSRFLAAFILQSESWIAIYTRRYIDVSGHFGLLHRILRVSFWLRICFLHSPGSIAYQGTFTCSHCAQLEGFRSYLSAITSVFQLSVGSWDWESIYEGGPIAIIFFFLYTLIGTIMLLNLLIAVISLSITRLVEVGFWLDRPL